MPLSKIRLKKKEDHRIRSGHPWIFSNEIDTSVTPLKSFSPGEEVLVEAHDKTIVGVAYVNPHSLITARIFSYDPHDRLNTNFFKTKINSAYQLRKSLFCEPYYRLVFGESDFIPGLIVDRYENDFVFQINTFGLEDKTEIIAEALSSIIPDTKSVLLHNETSVRKQEGLELYVKPLLGQPPDEIELVENDIHFLVPLKQGQKTGWFYDHRLNRARLKAYVNDKTVLDVFSYLGAFGIQAGKFGAKQIDCVDASELACGYIEKNAALNNIANKMNVTCSDAFDALKDLLHKNKKYDVIILDPPAFVKKAKDLKAGLIAYQRLNELALKLLSPNGILVSCSCSMHVNMEDLIQIIKRSALRSRTQAQLLERGHQGPDHPIHIAIPETDYLKAIFLRKIQG